MFYVDCVSRWENNDFVKLDGMSVAAGVVRRYSLLKRCVQLFIGRVYTGNIVVSSIDIFLLTMVIVTLSASVCSNYAEACAQRTRECILQPLRHAVHGSQG